MEVRRLNKGNCQVLTPMVKLVGAMLFYELIVDSQKQEGGCPLSHEHRIVTFVYRFKDERGKDRTNRGPQEKIGGKLRGLLF